jgi:hypothetical protein
MNTPRKLRLGPLPKTDTVKLTIVLPMTLKAELDRYAALHGELYGESVDGGALIPHMLEAFMARDRAFKRASAPSSNGRHAVVRSSVE